MKYYRIGIAGKYSRAYYYQVDDFDIIQQSLYVDQNGARIYIIDLLHNIYTINGAEWLQEITEEEFFIYCI